MWGLLLTGWLGFRQVRLEPSVLTRRVTTTDFKGFALNPKASALPWRDQGGGSTLLFFSFYR
jgi:hypothetical protein